MNLSLEERNSSVDPAAVVSDDFKIRVEGASDNDREDSRASSISISKVVVEYRVIIPFEESNDLHEYPHLE